MADNYIEKRMEELRGGAGPRPSRVIQGIDALCVRCASYEGAEPDESYKVHRLQVESILNVISKAEIAGVRAERAGDAGIALVSDDILAAGRVLQLVYLKAADMGLSLVRVSVSDPSYAVEVRICRRK